MHMLMFIIIFVIAVVAVVMMVMAHIVFGTVRRLRDAARRAMGLDPFDDASYGDDSTGRNSRQYGYTQRRSSHGGASSTGGDTGSARTQRTHRAQNGVTVIDQRSPEQAGRKIFSKNEGEYVDFEEEK